MLDYNICQLQLYRNKIDDKLIHNVSAADRIDRPGGLIKTTQGADPDSPINSRGQCKQLAGAV